MNNDGLNPFLYRDQKAAEEQASIYRDNWVGLINHLEELNESVDSLKLAELVRHQKFLAGIACA